MNETQDVTCLICGYKTLYERGDWEICEICRWEDDVVINGNDPVSPANRDLSVSEAQVNFIRIGASSPKKLANARKPNDTDVLDVDWKLIPEAVALLKATS